MGSASTRLTTLIPSSAWFGRAWAVAFDGEALRTDCARSLAHGAAAGAGGPGNGKKVGPRLLLSLAGCVNRLRRVGCAMLSRPRGTGVGPCQPQGPRKHAFAARHVKRWARAPRPRKHGTPRSRSYRNHSPTLPRPSPPAP